jgi:hypothetical protein
MLHGYRGARKRTKHNRDAFGQIMSREKTTFARYLRGASTLPWAKPIYSWSQIQGDLFIGKMRSADHRNPEHLSD